MGEAYQILDQSQAYFLTFQVVGWAVISTRKIYRDIIIDSLSYCRREKGLLIYAYVIMSNHMHVIFQSKTNRLSDSVRDFKRHTSKKILDELRSNNSESRRAWLTMIFRYHARYNKRTKEMQFWTHENHAVELNSNELITSRLEYIHQNPIRAGWVENPEDYIYSSSRNYAGIQGIIEIDLI